MLEIQDLHVSVHGTPVLKGIDLKVEAGETFILFGPNGSGKTTLLMTLMGFSGYEVTRGKIIFKGHDITYAPMYERARLGIGMSFQRPPTIHGLPTGKMVELCGRGRKMDIPAMAKRVHFDTFLDRDVNAGFSGGEIKRSELLQLMAQQPNLLLFDEPESGVDLENMALVGKTVRKLLDGVTHKMLSNQLKELAADGLVERIDYGEVPPRVDYRLTPNGEALMPIFDDIQAYIRKNACSNCCGDKPAAPYGARHGCCE